MVEPKVLGTLIVVVAKARNLPNLSRFGKQDPFVSITVGTEKKKTKAIKRGGQHPEWDEEMRFTIMQDADDILAASAAEAAANSLRRKPDGLPPLPADEVGVVTPATMASKSRVTKSGKKVGKSLKLACYADDPKEPELIGEAIVSIEDVLKLGEEDEWYEVQTKGKFCGEVFLELTFYSNAPPPVKRGVPRPLVHNPSAPIRPQVQSAATGMNLYIPPYGSAPAASPGATGVPGVAPGRPPPTHPGLHGAPLVAAAAAVAPGRVPHSSSFSELGLPPQSAQAHSIPGQPAYHSGGLPPNAVDSLSMPMQSMSLGPSYRPNGGGLPMPPQQQQYGSVSSHGHGHSNSLDNNHNNGAAPWAQNPQQQQSGPQRPMSAVNAVSGMYDAGPRVPSPAQMPQGVPQPHHHRTNSASLGVPGSAAVPGGYISPSTPAYGAPPVPVPADPYAQAAPYPPQPSPQAPFTPPGHRRHSSFGPNYQATPPQPTPPQQPYPAAQPPYGQPPPQPSYTPAPQQPFGSAPPTGDYPPVPPPPQKRYSAGGAYDPLRQGNDPFSNNNPPLSGGYPQAPYPPTLPPASQQQQQQLPPPTTTQSPPPATSTGTYVPWYMQTQPNAATPPPATGNYGTPPLAHTPAPPPRVGYYPSDELYAMQANQQAPPPVPPAPSQSPYQQHQPYPPQAPYPPQQPSSQSAFSNNSGYASTPPPAPPAADAPWSHLQHQQPSYTNSPQSQSQTLYYAQQGAGSGSDFRPTTVVGDAGWNTAAPPMPVPPGGSNANRDWRSYLSSLSNLQDPHGSPQAAPPVPPPPAPRVPSPIPPPRPYSSNAGQQDWYNTPPPAVPNSIMPEYRPPTQPQWR